MTFVPPTLIVMFLTFSGIVTANAKDAAANDFALLDRPDAIQHIAAKTPTDPAGALSCSYYKDLMVRETDTQTPAFGDATLVAIAAGSIRPPCDIAANAGAVSMKTASFTFIGRKGPVLFFREIHPKGAAAFLVIDAVDGRSLYHDSKFGDGFRTVSTNPKGNHLRYIRGVNGTCSLYKEGPACWAKMMNDGKIPRVMAQARPSVQACGTAYRQLNMSADVPSIVYYEVDVTIVRSGKVRVNSRGPTNCAPLS